MITFNHSDVMYDSPPLRGPNGTIEVALISIVGCEKVQQNLQTDRRELTKTAFWSKLPKT